MAFAHQLCMRMPLWLVRVAQCFQNAAKDQHLDVVTRAALAVAALFRQAMSMMIRHPTTGALVQGAVPPAVLAMYRTMLATADMLQDRLPRPDADGPLRCAICKLIAARIFAYTAPSKASKDKTKSVSTTDQGPIYWTGPDSFTVEDLPASNAEFNVQQLGTAASGMFDQLMAAMTATHGMRGPAAWTSDDYAELLTTGTWVVSARPIFASKLSAAVIALAKNPPAAVVDPTAREADVVRANVLIRPPIRLAAVRLLRFGLPRGDAEALLQIAHSLRAGAVALAELRASGYYRSVSQQVVRAVRAEVDEAEAAAAEAAANMDEASFGAGLGSGAGLDASGMDRIDQQAVADIWGQGLPAAVQAVMDGVSLSMPPAPATGADDAEDDAAAKNAVARDPTFACSVLAVVLARVTGDFSTAQAVGALLAESGALDALEEDETTGAVATQAGVAPVPPLDEVYTPDLPELDGRAAWDLSNAAFHALLMSRRPVNALGLTTIAPLFSGGSHAVAMHARAVAAAACDPAGRFALGGEQAAAAAADVPLLEGVADIDAVRRRRQGAVLRWVSEDPSQRWDVVIALLAAEHSLRAALPLNVPSTYAALFRAVAGLAVAAVAQPDLVAPAVLEAPGAPNPALHAHRLLSRLFLEAPALPDVALPLVMDLMLSPIPAAAQLGRITLQAACLASAAGEKIKWLRPLLIATHLPFESVRRPAIDLLMAEFWAQAALQPTILAFAAEAAASCGLPVVAVAEDSLLQQRPRSIAYGDAKATLSTLRALPTAASPMEKLTASAVRVDPRRRKEAASLREKALAEQRAAILHRGAVLQDMDAVQQEPDAGDAAAAARLQAAANFGSPQAAPQEVAQVLPSARPNAAESAVAAPAPLSVELRLLQRYLQGPCTPEDVLARMQLLVQLAQKQPALVAFLVSVYAQAGHQAAEQAAQQQAEVAAKAADAPAQDDAELDEPDAQGEDDGEQGQEEGMEEGEEENDAEQPGDAQADQALHAGRAKPALDVVRALEDAMEPLVLATFDEQGAAGAFAAFSGAPVLLRTPGQPLTTLAQHANRVLMFVARAVLQHIVAGRDAEDDSLPAAAAEAAAAIVSIVNDDGLASFQSLSVLSAALPCLKPGDVRALVPRIALAPASLAAMCWTQLLSSKLGPSPVRPGIILADVLGLCDEQSLAVRVGQAYSAEDNAGADAMQRVKVALDGVPAPLARTWLDSTGAFAGWVVPLPLSVADAKAACVAMLADERLFHVEEQCVALETLSYASYDPALMLWYAASLLDRHPAARVRHRVVQALTRLLTRQGALVAVDAPLVPSWNPFALLTGNAEVGSQAAARAAKYDGRAPWNDSLLVSYVPGVCVQEGDAIVRAPGAPSPAEARLDRDASPAEQLCTAVVAAPGHATAAEASFWSMPHVAAGLTLVLTRSAPDSFALLVRLPEPVLRGVLQGASGTVLAKQAVEWISTSKAQPDLPPGMADLFNVPDEAKQDVNITQVWQERIMPEMKVALAREVAVGAPPSRPPPPAKSDSQAGRKRRRGK